MSRALIDLAFVLLLPFLKLERTLSEVQKGRKFAMIKFYNLVMDSRHNPLSNIPDTNTRHLVMQVLAWMGCNIQHVDGLNLGLWNKCGSSRNLTCWNICDSRCV